MQEFCNYNNCEHVLETSNEFVSEILPKYMDIYNFDEFRIMQKSGLG